MQVEHGDYHNFASCYDVHDYYDNHYVITVNICVSGAITFSTY
jgi:hypothetical protein